MKSTTELLATLDTKPTETMPPLPPTTMPAKTTTSIKTNSYPIYDINMKMPTLEIKKDSTTRSSRTRKDIVEHIYPLLFLTLTFVISFLAFTYYFMSSTRKNALIMVIMELIQSKYVHALAAILHACSRAKVTPEAIRAKSFCMKDFVELLPPEMFKKNFKKNPTKIKNRDTTEHEYLVLFYENHNGIESWRRAIPRHAVRATVIKKSVRGRDAALAALVEQVNTDWKSKVVLSCLLLDLLSFVLSYVLPNFLLPICLLPSSQVVYFGNVCGLSVFVGIVVSLVLGLYRLRHKSGEWSVGGVLSTWRSTKNIADDDCGLLFCIERMKMVFLSIIGFVKVECSTMIMNVQNVSLSASRLLCRVFRGKEEDANDDTCQESVRKNCRVEMEKNQNNGMLVLLVSSYHKLCLGIAMLLLVIRAVCALPSLTNVRWVVIFCVSYFVFSIIDFFHIKVNTSIKHIYTHRSIHCFSFRHS